MPPQGPHRKGQEVRLWPRRAGRIHNLAAAVLGDDGHHFGVEGRQGLVDGAAGVAQQDGFPMRRACEICWLGCCHQQSVLSPPSFTPAAIWERNKGGTLTGQIIHILAVRLVQRQPVGPVVLPHIGFEPGHHQLPDDLPEHIRFHELVQHGRIVHVLLASHLEAVLGHFRHGAELVRGPLQPSQGL